MELHGESDTAFELGQKHEFHYSVIPFGGKAELSQIHLARRGLEFVNPPYIVDSSSYKDNDLYRLPMDSVTKPVKGESLIELQGDHSVICTAIYQMDSSLVIRLYESEGLKADSVVKLSKPIISAEESDVMLTHTKKLTFNDNQLKITFLPFEIKTVVLKLA
jgi:alpha-mannosidase